MTIHNFEESLAWGERASDAPFWGAVYHKAFPDMASCMRNRGNNEAQRRGVDRVILLNNGRVLYIDEKKRSRAYDDILLEYISVDTTGAPGWIEKDLAIDYLAYAFMPTRICYLFDWPLLRRAWVMFKDKWIANYKRIEAKNNGYTTISVAVPTDKVRGACVTAQIIDVSTELAGWQEHGADSASRQQKEQGNGQQ